MRAPLHHRSCERERVDSRSLTRLGENSPEKNPETVGAALCRDFQSDVIHRGVKPLLQFEPSLRSKLFFTVMVHSLTLAATGAQLRGGKGLMNRPTHFVHSLALAAPLPTPIESSDDRVR